MIAMVPTTLLQYLAQSFSAAVTSASRPALTFFIIQSSILIGVQAEWLSIAPGIAWMIHPALFAMGLILTIIESMAQHDEDIAMMMNDFKIHQITAACGTYASVLLFSSLGLPTEEAMQMIQEQGASSSLVNSTQDMVIPYAQDQDASTMQLGVAAGAVISNLSITYVRGYIHEYLDDLDLLPIWQKIETGGVIGALILLLLAPLLCLFLLVIVLFVGAVLGFTIRTANKLKDSRERYQCPSCNHRVRKEAIICSACRVELDPQKLLATDGEKIGLMEAFFPKKKPIAEPIL